MVRSHSFHWADFDTDWYKRWAKELRQTEKGREDYALFANKFWQNAVMAQALLERGALREGAKAIGFGVGQERLPALFAKYGVHVTATDQDFTTQKAGRWSEHELARGTQSLNQLGICEESQFAKQVEYMPVDMTRISKKLHNKYDFLWSNCALGHLGSIPEGLRFITESLACLAPGGWAVHTTELNILSNNDTVTDGSTVIFRLKDIYHLQKTLIAQGFKIVPFVLTLGNGDQDKRISLSPQFGNDYSKIQFRGHLATQIVLLMHKPKAFQGKSGVNPLSRLAAFAAHRGNLGAINRYRQDPTIKGLLDTRKTDLGAIQVVPVEARLRVSIPKGQSRTLAIKYKNKSLAPLLGVSTDLTANPIVLATTKPQDRISKFADGTWLSGNRPSASLRAWSTKSKDSTPVEYVPPEQNFLCNVTLSAKRLQKGMYTESFCLVQELVGWIDNSTVTVTIEVI
ncbi:MAG TPA: class I SAM-dependent methyltransferase [Patescibacteria group bacterium]|nr:class I SAM-dependent methyltransferase [Patescibacteria group bacterium]